MLLCLVDSVYHCDKKKCVLVQKSYDLGQYLGGAPSVVFGVCLNAQSFFICFGSFFKKRLFSLFQNPIGL